MRLYLDTADAAEARALSRWGAFAGVTTNPVLLAGAGLDLRGAAVALAEAQPGDVFVQVAGDDPDTVEAEVRSLSTLVPTRLMVKLPPTPVGLEVMSRLRDERIWTAATALFTLGQALLAANAGADVLIPFFSRMAEAGADAERDVADMVALCERRGGRPRVLVASLKTPGEVLAVARRGAWGAAIPPAVARELLRSDGTEAALARFHAAAPGRAGAE
jgi:TalC/MipB family fructose-6-phosphate aldolase